MRRMDTENILCTGFEGISPFNTCFSAPFTNFVSFARNQSVICQRVNTQRAGGETHRTPRNACVKITTTELALSTEEYAQSVSFL